MRATQETLTFVIEVGPRAALWAETCRRDLRWFRGLFRG